MPSRKRRKVSALKVQQIETIFMRQTVGQQPQALGKGRMVALYVINTFSNMDLTANNVDVMVGGENGQPEQILPGAVSSLIYARDLENVYARAANPSPVVITLGSDPSLRGTYTFRGIFNGRPYYNLDGADDNPIVSAISFDGASWVVYSAAGFGIYTSNNSPAIPSLADWSGTGTAEVLQIILDVPLTVTAGTCTATIQAAGFNGNAPLVVIFAVANGDNATDVAAKAVIALNANAVFAAFFSAAPAGRRVNITFDTIAANDTTALLTINEETATGLNPTESVIETPGVADAVFTTVDGVDVTIKLFRKTER